MPIVIGVATAAKYIPNHPVAELAINLLPEPAANVVSEVAQKVGAADPQYIAVVVAAVIYWATQERLASAFMELVNMGLKSIIQRARGEVVAEAHTKGRTEMLRELKAKAPPEIQDWLNEAGNDLNGSDLNGSHPNDPKGGNSHRT